MTLPMPHRTSRGPRDTYPAPPPIPPLVGWIMAVIVAVGVAALSTYEVTGSVLSAILAGLLAMPVAGGGAYLYRRRRRGTGVPPLVLTLLVSLAVGSSTVAGLSCMSGCSAGTQQRIVTATASAARAADSALASAFEVAAAVVVDEVLAEMPDASDDEQWAAWCERIEPTWEVMARIECGIVALGQAAVTGQAALDAAAGGNGDGMGASALLRWAPPVAGLLAVIASMWTAIDGDAPDELQAAIDLLDSFGLAPAPDLSCEIGPPPGCPATVTP